MYRPFLFTIVFLLPGLIVGSYIISTTLFALFAAIGVLGAIFIKDKKAKAILAGIAFFCFGAFYYDFRKDLIIGNVADYAGEKVRIVGRVYDGPVLQPNKATYEIDALYVYQEQTNKKTTGKIRVSVLNNSEKPVLFQYGDVVRFSGDLRLPQGRRNPGAMDYRMYLMQKGITCSMYARDMQALGITMGNPLVKAAYSVRQRLSQFYENNLPRDLSSLLMGIILGLKGDISAQTLQMFSDAGIIHVLAVSGLNVALIYGFIDKVLALIGAGRILTLIAGIISVIFYTIMAGASPSIVRAAIMVSVLMLGKAIGRDTDSLNSLCLAALILLLINPMNLFNLSFQLSFSAALGIILFYNRFNFWLESLPKFISSSLAVILAAQVLVWPFVGYYFHKISIIGFVSNLILVPLVSIVLILGLVGGMAGLVLPWTGSIIIKLAGILLLIVEKLVYVSSALPGATLVIPAIPGIFFVIYFALLAFLFYIFPSYKDGRYGYIIAGLLIVALFLTLMPKNADLEVTFIDVGQGDAILIKTRKGKTVLIDGGGTPGYYSDDFDIGRDVVKPFLYSKGTTKINVAVFSHFDDDHAQGLLSILKDMKVDTVIYGQKSDSEIYKEMLSITENKGIKTLQLWSKDSFEVDGVSFEVLNPQQDRPSADENDGSLVLKMNFKNLTFLFTGDLGISGEIEMMKSHPDIMADVLKIAHHGSKGSTSQEFLSRVNPSFAVISVGQNNTFGHPSLEVIKRLEQRGIKTYRTDLDGAVTFKIEQDNVRIYTTIPKGR